VRLGGSQASGQGRRAGKRANVEFAYNEGDVGQTTRERLNVLDLPLGLLRLGRSRPLQWQPEPLTDGTIKVHAPGLQTGDFLTSPITT
jgi:hypothetical protein